MLSYEFIAGRLRHLDPELADGRVIVAHLGNGASLCALRQGRSIDTTMGLTPLDGLMMGTRCGNIDPGVILYLARERGLTPTQVQDLLYRRSGLLGASGGIASDMPSSSPAPILARNRRSNSSYSAPHARSAPSPARWAA